MLWKGIVTIKDNDTPFSKQFTRNGAVLSVNRAGKVHAVRSATAVHVTRTVDVPASTQVAPVPKPLTTPPAEPRRAAAARLFFVVQSRSTHESEVRMWRKLETGDDVGWAD